MEKQNCGTLEFSRYFFTNVVYLSYSLTETLISMEEKGKFKSLG